VRRRVLTVLVLTLLPPGCTSDHPSAAHEVLTASGRIGSLRIDRSTHADVVAFAGRPDVERRGVEYDSTPYLALGYACLAKPNDDAFPLLESPRTGRTGPYCKTVFWLNRRTRKLGDFYTSSARYSERHGVGIGMSTAAAEHLLHRRVYVGCEANLPIDLLAIAFDGGVGRKTSGSAGLRLVGGHVYAFAVEGRRSAIGVFDCL
jgi:hypothetical protein